MNCMKCGREIGEDQVFCEECLLDMEKYPVKPGTTVQLPKRREQPGAKKSHPRRKAPLPLEEQVKHLRKRLRFMAVLSVILLVLVALLGWQTAVHLMEEDVLPGQNYSAMGSSEPADAE